MYDQLLYRTVTCVVEAQQVYLPLDTKIHLRIKSLVKTKVLSEVWLQISQVYINVNNHINNNH